MKVILSLVLLLCGLCSANADADDRLVKLKRSLEDRLVGQDIAAGALLSAAQEYGGDFPLVFGLIGPTKVGKSLTARLFGQSWLESFEDGFIEFSAADFEGESVVLQRLGEALSAVPEAVVVFNDIQLVDLEVFSEIVPVLSGGKLDFVDSDGEARSASTNGATFFLIADIGPTEEFFESVSFSQGEVSDFARLGQAALPFWSSMEHATIVPFMPLTEELVADQISVLLVQELGDRYKGVLWDTFSYGEKLPQFMAQFSEIVKLNDERYAKFGTQSLVEQLEGILTSRLGTVEDRIAGLRELGQTEKLEALAALEPTKTGQQIHVRLSVERGSGSLQVLLKPSEEEPWAVTWTGSPVKLRIKGMKSHATLIVAGLFCLPVLFYWLKKK